MLFETRLALKDSEVTLSPTLVKYMIRHNRKGQRALKVMPFVEEAYDCSQCKECTDMNCTGHVVKMYGLDINPPIGDDMPKDYYDTLDEVQWDPTDEEMGFLLSQPNVAGVVHEYGLLSVPTAHTPQQEWIVTIESRRRYGRTQYMILRPPTTRWQEIWRSVGIEVTRWLVRMGW